MNEYSKELMHKGFTEDIQWEKTIYSTPEEIRRMRQTDRLRSEGAKGSQSAIRTLANRAWYEKHKAWKKAYNKKYYQDNKEYWHNYYKFAHDELKMRSKFAEEAARNAEEAKSKYGVNSKEYKRAKDSADTNAQWVKERQVDLKAAKINIDRMVADQKWYEDTTKHMKVTDAWSSGSKTIRDAGKSAVNKILSATKQTPATLSGFAKSIKGLFK